jgi:hypothetical protein
MEWVVVTESMCERSSCVGGCECVRLGVLRTSAEPPVSHNGCKQYVFQLVHQIEQTFKNHSTQ